MHWAKRHPLTLFYSIASFVACGVMAVLIALSMRNPAYSTLLPDMWAWFAARHLYSNALTIARYAFATGTLGALLIFVYAGAPTFAAGVTLGLAQGAGGVRRWLARLRPWGPGASRARALSTYAWICAVHLVVLSAFLLSTKAAAPSDRWAALWSVFGDSVPLALGIALIGLFIDEGGLLEELGWRGFALPLLQGRMAPFPATMVLGTLWWAWHLPIQLPALLAEGLTSTFLYRQFTFLVLCLASAVVITYCVNRTGGSVLPAIFVHAGPNVWSKAASGPLWELTNTDFRTGICVVIALVVLVIDRRRLGLEASETSSEGEGSEAERSVAR